VTLALGSLTSDGTRFSGPSIYTAESVDAIIYQWENPKGTADFYI